MAPPNSQYFATSPDGELFRKSKPELQMKTQTPPNASMDIQALLTEGRATQKESEDHWAAGHPIQMYGYSTRMDNITARDGHEVGIKVYRPLPERNPARQLPLLFDIHGGGWVRGSPVSEEMWMLYALFQNFDFLVVSVDYRLAPEHPYPVFTQDCSDALQAVCSQHTQLGFDPSRVYLAGSSAGACITAVLSQQLRDSQRMTPGAIPITVKGVILNVPVLCDPRHFPIEEFECTSYDQCHGALLNSQMFRLAWHLAVPKAEDGEDPGASPLLGNLEGLPPHLIFVAGQDPVRDEGIAYNTRLRNAGVTTSLHIYGGVPHVFAEFWELDTTKRFVEDLIDGLQTLLAI